MSINFNLINCDNLYLLHEFIRLHNSPHFRYYENRLHSPVSTIIAKHILTIVMTSEDDRVIGYAHLDHDDQSGRVWFGIYILEDYQSRGYGKRVLRYVFDFCESHEIGKVYLAVDKDNERAVAMYLKNGFVIESDNGPAFVMYRET